MKGLVKEAAGLAFDLVRLAVIVTGIVIMVGG